MSGHDIVVVGASAGGVEALKELVRHFPADLPASIFIVLHIAPQYPSYLPDILSKQNSLPVISPNDEEPFKQGLIYVAPPDRHLLIEQERVRIVRGPKENRHRPAIDPLFRSAAWVYGPRVVGIVLSGTLSDGVAGLWAVKTCGGVTVVQDPNEASFPDMPLNAMKNFDVAHILQLQGIATLITRLAHEPVMNVNAYHVPEKVKLETQFAMLKGDLKDMNTITKPSSYTCPTCHGAMGELEDDGLLRYRCHVGHSFTSDSLLDGQGEKIEETVYTAIAVMEEKSAILRRMSKQFGSNNPGGKTQTEKRADDLDKSTQVIRDLIASRSL
jgi:two-component system, chemotaxis family, protein-glutamate methylesterase/glutaminase